MFRAPQHGAAQSNTRAGVPTLWCLAWRKCHAQLDAAHNTPPSSCPMRMDDEPIYGDAREVREMRARERMLRPYIIGCGVLASALFAVIVAWAAS